MSEFKIRVNFMNLNLILNLNLPYNGGSGKSLIAGRWLFVLTKMKRSFRFNTFTRGYVCALPQVTG
jgi:hypothetical protein